jgi:hypothetical protein
MKLLEFITYCELSGVVESKTQVTGKLSHIWKRAFKGKAESYWKIVLLNDNYLSYIAYAVRGDDAIIAEMSLDCKVYNSRNIQQDAVDLQEIIKAFIPDDIS